VPRREFTAYAGVHWTDHYQDSLMSAALKISSIPLVLFLALTAGCSVTGGSAVITDREPDYREPAPDAAPPPAVDKTAPYADLVARAAAAREAGHYEEALTLLERAQRIDPASADIYLALAQTHHARGDTSQARATAERGLLYCKEERQCSALQLYIR
jgi:tetratricopeptide (TPR) repeat protein